MVVSVFNVFDFNSGNVSWLEGNSTASGSHLVEAGLTILQASDIELASGVIAVNSEGVGDTASSSIVLADILGVNSVSEGVGA